MADSITDCVLRETENGFWCPSCDPRKRRLLSKNMPRNCRVQTAKSTREKIEQRVHFQHHRFNGENNPCRPLEDIDATLNKCFSPCRFLDEGLCPQYGNPQHGCKKGERWIEHILYNECGLFEPKDAK